MKTNRYLLGIVLLVAGTMPTFSQVSNDNEDGVYKIDERTGRNEFVPGQVLVKFKDESTIKVQRTAKGQFRAASISKVDQLLRSYGVKDMEKLFPAAVTKPKAQLGRRLAPNGTMVQEKNLDKVFWVKTNIQRSDSTLQLIEQLKALPEVEYAEPNYKAYITADVPSGYGATTTAQAQSVRRAPVAVETTASVICSKPSNNPLYFRQYGITQQNIHKLWNKPIINKKRPVIAILDTGVDITHPDLADNIWTNTQESEGETAYDDDGNSIVDDVHGWNFVDNYYDLTDRNGHGTHVAGIAAAVDNNLGIVGANPLALIMPVKVMDDRGQGDIGNIARAINYAVENGADVINMSFGSSRLSNTMKDALDNAYQAGTILVASAGNNGMEIYDLRGTSYPAAYYLVLGVEASGSNLQRASYSNYDPDGPIYSEDGIDGRNYEFMVPGDKIYSTLPGGRYNQLNGTSMSAPLLAGAISALQMVKDYPSKDVLFGDVIHLKADFAAIYSDDTPRTPKIDLASMNVDDNVEGNSNIDGQVDVNETIKFYPILRNTWADATDIKLTLTVDENYQSFVEIKNPQVDFGWSLSAYGRQTAKIPIDVIFKDNIGDNTRIKFQLNVSYNESAEYLTQDVYITVNNRNVVSGIIDNDMLLTADKTWYWEKFYLDENATLTIEPGTKIVVSSKDQVVKGQIVCEGTKDNHIIFDYNGEQNTKGHIFTGTVKYCEFKNFHFYNGSVLPGFCFDFANRDPETGRVYHTFDHCAFDAISFDHNIYNGDDRYSLNNCMVYGIKDQIKPYSDRFSIQNSNVLGNGIYYNNSEETPFISYSNLLYPFYNGNWGDDDNPILAYAIDELGTLHLPNTIYYGTSSEKVLRKHSICYPECGWGVIDYSNMQKVPFAEAPGIVWKVVVNGYDAQDEYEDFAPLGVGKHKFEVYFNRPMNKNVAPQISFGVREPYTQNPVDEEGEGYGWNEDGTIYTVYKTINGRTQSDGVNRIYVHGAEDNEFFECPYEKTRFNINIQAAGALATGFAAEAKMGRVDLTWNNENNDFEDAMGFNVYRFNPNVTKKIPAHYDENDNWVEETEVADTIRLNQEILDIETEAYTDYAVTPGETYYYMYKVLSTDLKEYDVSNVVAATPLTSTKGDADGSGEVDVNDVVATVNYVVGVDQKPFIFEAADMNSDLAIDVLDVIGIVQKIMTTPSRVFIESAPEAVYTIEDGVLYVESPVTLAGLQVQLSTDEEPVSADDMKGFELASAWLTDSDYRLLAYSFGSKVLEPGKHAIMKVGGAELTSLRLSDTQGHRVNVVAGETTAVKDAMGSKVMNTKGVYNLNGQKVTGNSDSKLRKGVYIINGEKVIK